MDLIRLFTYTKTERGDLNWTTVLKLNKCNIGINKHSNSVHLEIGLNIQICITLDKSQFRRHTELYVCLNGADITLQLSGLY